VPTLSLYGNRKGAAPPPLFPRPRYAQRQHVNRGLHANPKSAPSPILRPPPFARKLGAALEWRAFPTHPSRPPLSCARPRSSAFPRSAHSLVRIPTLRRFPAL